MASLLCRNSACKWLNLIAMREISHFPRLTRYYGNSLQQLHLRLTSKGPQSRQKKYSSSWSAWLSEIIQPKPLLAPRALGDESRKCVIIDLDETLVHSSFKPESNADFIVHIVMNDTIHPLYVLKRPYCDEFLKRMGELFECVLFTAGTSHYADPIVDLLDKHNAFSRRLFRESCVFHKGVGNYVKDLSKLGRDLNKVCIVDNSPHAYFFHPDNAVPVTSWFDDPNDTELLDLIPFFEALDKVDNVLSVLGQNRNPSGEITSETKLP